MKTRTKFLIGAILASLFVTALNAPAPASANTDVRFHIRNDDMAVVTTEIRNTFSEFLTPYTGVLEWDVFAGTPNSQMNIARVTTRREIMSFAVVEGTAYDLVQYMRAPAYSGALQIASGDRAGCLVGALVRGFLNKNQASPVQDEINTLQALVYQQFDVPQQGLSVSQARASLTALTESPVAVRGFDLGFAGSLPACGVLPTKAKTT